MTAPLPAAAPSAPASTAAPNAWARAASGLAARTTRRTRLGAFLPALTVGTTLGAAAAVAAKATDLATGAAATAVLAVPAALGLLVGLVRAGRVVPTTLADAAWALDRLARAQERGLTAALAVGPAAREAAGVGVPVAPPRVRLKPPKGLVPALAAGLVGVVSVLWPLPSHPAHRSTVGATIRRAASGATAEAVEGARDEERARAAEREAAAERDLRAALGLPPTGAVDASHVLQALSAPNPDAVAAARRAAAGSEELRRALGSGDPAPAAAAVAKALSDGAAERAEAWRREAAALRASAGVVPVPPERRALVERYLSGRVHAPAGDSR